MRRLKWLGLGLVVGVLALGLSVKTYIASLNRQEALIAEEQAEELAASRPDYCVSASADKATMNPGDILTLSSVSNTSINGFFYATYNLDNLYGPDNPKPVCTGTGTHPDCPNGGTPFIFSDPNNKTDGTGLRQRGSTQITYGRLFVTDKSTGQQAKNLQFNAYFSLNGGEWSWPKPDCVAYTKMASPEPTAEPSPTADPSPEPSPNFQIRKFDDLDADGEKDAIEGTTSIAWPFQYRVNNGDWLAIETNAASGLSPKILLPKGSKVEVEELLLAGWTITTPNKQAQTLNLAGNTYTFNFGNKKVAVGGPGASPSPSPSPGTNNASFIIHKFLDANGNGIRETGEGATGRAWTFEYKINNGSKLEYVIEPDKETGAVIIVNKNDVVEVTELGQANWLNTTGLELTRTISENKQYVFYFGNYLANSDKVEVANFPPTQPDTGAPTWLTVGAVALGAILLTAKLLLRF